MARVPLSPAKPVPVDQMACAPLSPAARVPVGPAARAPLSPSARTDAGPEAAALALVTDIVAAGRVLVLTGAGLSTDSGIPDYRSPGAPPRSPMTEQEFRSGPVARQRYWARSHLGWQRMGEATPNGGHRALAALEQAGVVDLLITQNVDGLHGKAGSRTVVDLHGRIDEVVCLDCGQISSRAALHERMSRLNPDFGADADVVVAPDGDVEFSDTAAFRVPACRRCAGALKPNVVFFGGSVARPVVDRCFAAVDDAEALLVAGSSLTVMSGFRFVRHAVKRSIPVLVINRGPTRADDLPIVKLDAGCTPTLTAVATALQAL
nr:NAD-dependent protein deacetylase [Nakamurella endophytica]